MKKTDNDRYPHSASLFKFCKSVLDMKYQNSRIIDQDIGAILEYDPADCSHWKKGRKNIRSIYAIKAIASHLHVDEKVVFDIVSGEIELPEAFFEFQGYDSFNVDTKSLEDARKEYFRKNVLVWNKESELAFKNQYQVRRQEIVKAVSEVYKKVNFSEIPLYMPEVVSYYDDLALEPSEKDVPNIAQISKTSSGQFIIKHQSGAMKPYIRYAIARELGRYFLGHTLAMGSGNKIKKISPLERAECSLFAAMLLIPSTQLKNVIKDIDIQSDFMVKLADTFWVSKILMTMRFQDFITNGD